MSATKIATALREAGQKDPEAFLKVLRGLFAAFSVPITEDIWTVYVEDLADIQLDPLARACRELRGESKWMPKIAEIRARVAQWELDAAGVSTSPEMAWAEVLRLLQAEGTYRIPGKATDHGSAVEFADPVTAAIMTPTWWRALGQAPVDAIPSERHRFCEAYKAQTARVRRQIQCGTGPALPSATAQHQLDGGHR